MKAIMKADRYGTAMTPLAAMPEKEREELTRSFSKLPETERLIIARDNPALYGYLKRQQQRSAGGNKDIAEIRGILDEFTPYYMDFLLTYFNLLEYDDYLC